MTINELIEQLTRLKDKGLGDEEIKVEYNGPDAWTTLEINAIDIYDNGNIVIEVS